MGKKINEIDPVGTLTGDKLAFAGNPTNGKLFKATYDQVKAFINAGVGSKIPLEVGTTFYDVPDNTILFLVWFQGGNEATIGVGTSEEDNDIFEEGHLPPDDQLQFIGPKFIREATRLFFNGVDDTTIIIFIA